LEYWQIEPFGDEWRQTAMLGWTMIHRNRFKKNTDIETLMPVPKRQTPQQAAAILQSFFLGLKASNVANNRQHGGIGQGDRRAV
jgi:hypothetical protein